MKAILFLASWNWRMFRKLYFMVLGLLAVVELLILLFVVGTERQPALNFEVLFYDGYVWLAFAAGFVAVLAVCLQPVLQANRKAKGGYMLLTLPLPRWKILAGYVVATAIAVLGLLAWQVILCAAYYGPVMHVYAAATGVAAIWPGSFYRAMLRNPLLRLILPGDGFGLAILAMAVIAPAVMVPCAFVHNGWRRFVAFCVGLAGAGCCAVNLLLALSNMQPFTTGLSDNTSLIFVLNWAWLALLVLLAGSWLWGVRALHRSELV